MANTTTTKVTFWGVRGSTPTPERGTWRYGGNTACVEVVTGDGTRFILDCGTGIRLLGNRWEEQAGHRAIEAHILVTHYHWDHIQGIPFFHPFFQQQNRFHFYSFESKYLGPNSLRKVLEAQMASPYFPVDLSMLTAGREFHEVGGGEQFEINGTRVTTRWLNHPQGCLGYRLDTPGGSIVYATDNEPARREFAAPWAAMEGMAIQLNEKGVDVTMRESRVGPRRRLRFAATVAGIGEDGKPFEEKAVVRDITLYGAYLSLSNRPALQSELNLVIEANAADNHPSLLSLRGTVVYSEAAPEKYKTGIGVLFVEDEERGRTRD